jgi:HEAT repeat protein
MLRMSAGVLAGLCVLVAGTWILSRALDNHQTMYQGKPSYYWSEQLTNQDAGASNKAAAVLHSQIIPHLTNQMFSDTNDSKLKMALIDELNTLPGIQIDFIDSNSRRVQAVMELGTFGSGAKSAAPALLEALKRQDNVLCEPAARVLVNIQAEPEAVIPALIGCMVDDKGHGRSDVVEALGQYGPRAKAAVPVLVKLLKDRSSKEIIRAAPRALRRIDPEAAATAGAAP